MPMAKVQYVIRRTTIKPDPDFVQPAFSAGSSPNGTRSDERQRGGDALRAPQGGDPAARLDGVARRPEPLAEHRRAGIEVLDDEGQAPEALRTLDARLGDLE